MKDANLVHEEEIQELYWAHYRDLCLLAISKTQNLEVAQDIVQEFFPDIQWLGRKGPK